MTIEQLAMRLRAESQWSGWESWEQLSQFRRDKWIAFAKSVVLIFRNVNVDANKIDV